MPKTGAVKGSSWGPSKKVHAKEVEMERHSLTISTLIDVQGKYKEAHSFYARAIKIGRETLGDDHPHVATMLGGWAALLAKQVIIELWVELAST